jgi:uncharacterized protein (TIGR02246 family)
MSSHPRDVGLRMLRPASSIALLTGAVSLLILLPACDSSQAADAQASGGLVAAEVRSSPTPAQVQAVESLRDRFDAAWAAYDATAFASVFAEDAELVNPLGGFLAGREAIRVAHVGLFAGPFAGSTSTSSLRRIVFLSGAVVMVDMTIDLTGFQSLPPGLPQVEPGVVRTRVKWIVAQRAGTWEVIAQQMTALPPPP